MYLILEVRKIWNQNLILFQVGIDSIFLAWVQLHFWYIFVPIIMSNYIILSKQGHQGTIYLAFLMFMLKINANCQELNLAIRGERICRNIHGNVLSAHRREVLSHTTVSLHLCFTALCLKTLCVCSNYRTLHNVNAVLSLKMLYGSWFKMPPGHKCHGNNGLSMIYLNCFFFFLEKSVQHTSLVDKKSNLLHES